MNYLKIYESIIKNAKSKNRIKLQKNNNNYIYYENHHIFPKCLGGSDEKENKILLTAKEHYICHKLLTYIYKGDKRLGDAFHRMTFNKRGKHRISSRDYSYARELISSIPMSEEQKNKIGKSLKGRKKPIRTEEHNKNNSESHKNKIPWNKNKKCPQFAGKNNVMFGKSLYNVWKEKFGEKIAQQKLKTRAIKASKSMKGKNKKPLSF
jgi:hypothetical protein